MGMGCGFTSCFPSPYVFWLYPMVYGAVAQRSAASTVLISMISGETESYGELVMVEQLEETNLGNRGSWSDFLNDKPFSDEDSSQTRDAFGELRQLSCRKYFLV